jgi:hypothetical protein
MEEHTKLKLYKAIANRMAICIFAICVTAVVWHTTGGANGGFIHIEFNTDTDSSIPDLTPPPMQHFPGPNPSACIPETGTYPIPNWVYDDGGDRR